MRANLGFNVHHHLFTEPNKSINRRWTQKTPSQILPEYIVDIYQNAAKHFG